MSGRCTKRLVQNADRSFTAFRITSEKYILFEISKNNLLRNRCVIFFWAQVRYVVSGYIQISGFDLIKVLTLFCQHFIIC